MTETFYISLIWGIVATIVISLIAILIYVYCSNDNINNCGETFIKKYPKQAIDILKSNHYLKDDNSQKE